MADGKIIFSTALDNKGLEKELSDYKKKIIKTEDDIAKMREKRDRANRKADSLLPDLDKEKAKLADLKKVLAEMKAVSRDKSLSESTRAEAKANIPQASEDLADQKTRVQLLQREYNKLANSVDNYDNKIEDATIDLERNKTKAGEIAEQLAKTGPSSKKMADAMVKAEKGAQRFALRMREVVRSALVFTLITQALALFREWMGKVIKTNDEASAAVGRLKGALLTLVQPLVQVILPAFAALVNLLAAVVGEVARLMSTLFGATIDQSAEAAESLQAEVDALDATGAAAKKASKSLASFDEINKLSNNSAGGGGAIDTTAADFSWANGISEKLRQIAQDVLLIGTGFALWKISNSIPGTLGTILGKLGLIMIALGGILLFYEGFTDAWENGVDWGNLTLMLGGVAAAALALNAAFGPMAAGVALVAGGVLLLSVGFKDLIENGATLQNVLAIIAGIIGTGLGISLITHSALPLLIAGIAAVITAILAWQGNLEEFALAFKMIFDGIVDFFTGIFTGDMELAMRGVKNIFAGVCNAMITIFESVVNAIIDGLNWLISKANSLASKVGLGDLIPTIQRKDFSDFRVPYLAQGAVIPPNREFLAVLGDQKNGTNIETPLSTMIQAFKTAMMEMNMGGGQNEAYLVIDDEVLGKIIYKLYNKESRRVGVKLSEK